MEFTDLKVILSSFGLWVKVSAAYNPLQKPKGSYSILASIAIISEIWADLSRISRFSPTEMEEGLSVGGRLSQRSGPRTATKYWKKSPEFRQMKMRPFI